MVDLYDTKIFEFKVGDKVTWNKKIFKECPFVENEIAEISESLKESKMFKIGEMNIFWNWWEIVPIDKTKKLIYYIKFYYWYYTRFKRL